MRELTKASDTLARANRLLADGMPRAEVSSVAHVADQQARTALAISQARGNEVAIAGAELERERTRSEIRSIEAGRAKAQAASAQAETQVAQDQATSARAQTLAAQQQAMAAQQQASAAEAQIRDARRVASAAEQRASGAEQRAIGAEERASGAEQQSAAALSVMANAQVQAAELQKKLDALQAKRTERGMLVTLGDVLFDSNRADVRPAAQGSLRKLADFLKTYPDKFVLIEGHTDNVGSAATNEALSLRRAKAVDAALRRMGVPGGRIDTAGYGEEFPVADNKSNTTRALNRRVEVYIADNDQPVPARR
jgi:outer membrane protein OmpA-like peptidoglycan-associated protein